MEAKDKKLTKEDEDLLKKDEELLKKDEELQAKQKELEALEVKMKRMNNGCSTFCVFVSVFLACCSLVLGLPDGF